MLLTKPHMRLCVHASFHVATFLILMSSISLSVYPSSARTFLVDSPRVWGAPILPGVFSSATFMPLTRRRHLSDLSRRLGSKEDAVDPNARAHGTHYPRPVLGFVDPEVGLIL